MNRKYVELMQLSTSYARNLNRLKNSIFGEITRQTTRKSMKVVQIYSELPAYRNKDIVDYYPCHPKITQMMTTLRNYGLFRDEHEDFKEEFERLRKLRGKSNKYKERFQKKQIASQ